MSNGNALTIVKAAQNKGALVFANIENMETKIDLYQTEVTEINFVNSDFHTINGKVMPSKSATDRIGEASGIQFIQSACRVTAETRDDPQCGKRTVYRGEAQGKVRMPDGSWRISTVDEYEFDPVLRAMLDKNVTELNEKTKTIVGRTVLEYTKVARQRAATGARLRVIRQLTGMPPAFEKTDAEKPFVFTRVVQNTSYILQTPEGRAMATAQAIGFDVSALFGGRKVFPETAQAEPPNSNAAPPDDGPIPAAFPVEPDDTFPDFDDDPAPEAANEAADAFKAVSDELLGLVQDNAELLGTASKSGKIPFVSAKTELEDTNGTLESRRAMLKKIQDFIRAVDEAKKARGAA
jgi:hypothetical protein